MKEKISNTILDLSKIFAEKGKDLLLVGGCVRDYILNKEPKDYDLTTNASPDEIVNMINGKYKYDEFGSSFLVVVIFSDEHPDGIEIATYRSEVYDGKTRNPIVKISSKIEDSKRRDLTINSIYYDISNEKIYDPNFGTKDIKNSVIRFVGEASDRICEDPLRILRAIRFKHRLTSSSYTNKTKNAIIDNVDKLDIIERERINNEFYEGFKSSLNKYRYIKEHVSFGTIDYIFKGLKINRNVTIQPNINLYIAMLLIDNSIEEIENVLVSKLRFSRNLLRELMFLYDLKDFDYKEIPSLKKRQTSIGITDNVLNHWFCNISTNIYKSRLYLTFKPLYSVKKLMDNGFKGELLGRILNNRNLALNINRAKMIHKIQYFKDIEMNKTIGINFLKSEVQTFLGDMFTDTGIELGKKYNNNLLSRNKNAYHLTVISQEEINNLIINSNLSGLSQSFDNLFDIEIKDIKLKGVGKVVSNYKVSYFIVVESDTINMIRENYMLPKKDLHITIGFSHNDIHGVRKNKIMELTNTFLDELRNEYVKDINSFDFIKDLKGFPGDELDNIEIVKLTDTWAIFRYQSNKYIGVSYIDGLKITNIFETNDKYRILSYTLVNKKLKINI